MRYYETLMHNHKSMQTFGKSFLFDLQTVGPANFIFCLRWKKPLDAGSGQGFQH